MVLGQQVEDVGPRTSIQERRSQSFQPVQRLGPLVARTAHGLEEVLRTIQVLPVPGKWVGDREERWLKG